MRAGEEFSAADFGDARLSRRLIRVAAQAEVAPERSLPKSMGGDAELEATYRFLSNEKVTPEQILAPHVRMTETRCRTAARVVAAHDTSEFAFSGDREGLGRINETGQGFFGHFTLAIDGQDGGPLGVIGLETFVRLDAPHRKQGRHTERRPERDRESRRWWSQVEHAQQTLQGHPHLIHVMDREADDYTLFARMVGSGIRFVVRLRFDRRLSSEQAELCNISDALTGLEVRFTRNVQLSARLARSGKRPDDAHPSRAARSAKLVVTATRVTIRCPNPAPNTEFPLPATLALSVVHVREVDAPDGCEPVDWRLITSEPIETNEQIEAVIDDYRKRWLIEEYFKALKTGCAIERRQLTSAHALLNALAIFVPIAWSLLRLRHLTRCAPTAPAKAALTPLQIMLLQQHEKIRMKPDATARDALLAIAKLGGHLKRNGEPGWIVLGRGFDDLLLLELGAHLAIQARCDQS
jgi:IS4 transposase